VIRGVGAYLPERVVSNEELSETVDTSDAWIRQRTGIARRHIAAPGELTSDLACMAAQRAMRNAGVTAEDVDLIILATTTPDNTFPATATRVQARLGVRAGAAFDIQAVCTGFVYALTQADNMIRLGQAKCALVIGAEIYSRILDWQDRGTCVLFGDGAGAVVLRGEATNGVETERGVLSTVLGADGRFYDSLYVDGGPASTGTAGFVRMQGKEVFKQAVERMSSLVAGLLADQGLTSADLDWLIPHQANIRIIETMAKEMKLPESVIIADDIRTNGNTSAASIPLAMDALLAKHPELHGKLALMIGYGAGLVYAGQVVKLPPKP